MKLNRALWITAITSTILTVFSFLMLKSMHAGGEPAFKSLYVFAWQSTLLVQVTYTIFGFIAPASWLTLLALKLRKSAKAAPTVDFSKNFKFNQMRRMALIIAAIPGLALVPFALAALLSLLGQPANAVAGIFAIFAITSIIPGTFAMIALLVIALITLFKKTIDPETPRPKPHLLQINLAIITTAMPATAMLLMWTNSLTPCSTGCSIFADPLVNVAEFSYFAMWIVLAVIWLRTKPAKTTV